MDYKQTLEYLFNQLPVYQNIGGRAYKEGLDNSLALASLFDNPHNRYKIIHIGGTNGKGSTSHLLAAILQQSGYKVGLYTSPHLIDFRERIRINGEKIEEQYVVDFVANNKEQFEPITPSFFELTMTMAFKYFADKEVDIAIIEVGLGGRLDSTNIVTPTLSIITNVSLDHTQFLGDNEEKIAEEKAGIIKPQTPVIIGEATGTVKQIFEKKTQINNAPIIFAEDQNLIYDASPLDSGGWLLQANAYPNLKDELGGLPQVKNAATVLCAIDVLRKQGIHCSIQSVYSGFGLVTKLTGLMGRWQVLQEKNPKIVCDTGHNIGGITYIVKQLKTEKFKNLHIVFGMVNDKDIKHVLALMPKDAIYYFTKADIFRAKDEKELASEAASMGLIGQSFATVEEATKRAVANATDDDFIFIGGSNFVVADLLKIHRNIIDKSEDILS